MNLLERYKAACDFPGDLNIAEVESSLRSYCNALGVKREIVRLRRGWTLDDYPDLSKMVHEVLSDFEKKTGRKSGAARAALDASAALDARDALAARDALDAQILMHKFAEWCVYRRTWWWTGELSWLNLTHVGAVQLKKDKVTEWSQHSFAAYVAGAWLLIWTENTLYWVAKPTVTTEMVNGRKRLHNATGPTLLCDVENLYFWHGVLVPAFVVVKPEWITIKHIETENNAEVRRVMIQRYGTARYLKDSNAELVQELPENYYVRGLQGAKLYRKARKDDTDIVMVALQNSTAEPDGSVKEYMLRVQPDAYEGAASKDCHAAVASTWRKADGSLYFKRPQDYRPGFES